MNLLLLENKDNFEDHVKLLFPENEKKSEYISVTVVISFCNQCGLTQ